MSARLATAFVTALLIAQSPASAQAPFDLGGAGGGQTSAAPIEEAPLRGGVGTTGATPADSTGSGPSTESGGVPFFSAAPSAPQSPDGGSVSPVAPSGGNGSAGAVGGFHAAPPDGQVAPTFEPYRPPPPPASEDAAAGAAPFDLRGGTTAGPAGSPAASGSPPMSGDAPFSAGSAAPPPEQGGGAATPRFSPPPPATPGSPFSVGGGADEAGPSPFRIDTAQPLEATPGRGFSVGAPPPPLNAPSPAPTTAPSVSSTFSVAPPDPNAADGASPFQMQSGQPPPTATGQPRPSSPFSPNFVPDRDEAPVEAVQTAARGVDRPVLPRPDLRLTGETDFTVVTTYLSAAEAARPATFSIGIVNSVLVMPEASRLRVTINGRAVTEMQINSPGRAGRAETPLPPGLLRAGPNTIRIEATQRHRVDCSLRATYELWTMLVPSLTGFVFQGGAVPVNGLADLPSIGVDDFGATRINVIPVGSSGPERLSRIAAAVSAASVFGRFEHPVAKIVEPSGRLDRLPGNVALVIGTAAAVRQVTEIAAGEAVARPVVALLPDPRTGVPTLVVSGPTPDDVDRALARLSVQAERSAVDGPDRRFPWRAPDVPVFYGGEQLSLAELGVQTSEFSGRRFQTHFDMALPDDFYAAAYGEAILLLDAAFTPEVKPGSTIDIYVNKALAVTVNITSQDGGLYDKRQVKIPLRNFRPGPNRVHIEANLSTEADERCLPGATMPGRDRFVMFSSSIFRVAPFARFGELPNLAGFAAGAFPYVDGSGTPLPVYLVGEGPSSIGAASTLLARLSISAGTPLPNRFLSSAAEIEERSVVVIGAAPDLDPLILDQAGLSNAVLAAWSTPGAVGGASAAAAATPDEYESVLARLRALKLGTEPEVPDKVAAPPASDAPADAGGQTSEVYERWRSGVGGTGVSDVLNRFTLWLKESFGLTLDMLHLAQAENRIVRLAPRTTVVIAQSRGPGAAVSTWTVVTAPSGPLLASGVEGITAPQTWYTIGGSVAAYQETTGIVQTFFPASVFHVQTVPFTFQNARLIAANWFSINVLEYALALMLASGSLGIVSWVLIRQIGRENNT